MKQHCSLGSEWAAVFILVLVGLASQPAHSWDGDVKDSGDGITSSQKKYEQWQAAGFPWPGQTHWPGPSHPADWFPPLPPGSSSIPGFPGYNPLTLEDPEVVRKSFVPLEQPDISEAIKEALDESAEREADLAKGMVGLAPLGPLEIPFAVPFLAHEAIELAAPEPAGGTSGAGSGGSCPTTSGGPSNPCGSCPNGKCWNPKSAKSLAAKPQLATHHPISEPAHHPKPDPKPAHHAKTEPTHHPNTTPRSGQAGPHHSPTTGHPPTTPAGHPPTMPGGIHPVTPSGLGGLHGFRPGNPGLHSLRGPHHSDARLKRELVPVGRLPNGLNIYRFRYVGQNQLYVGVMAQEVAAIVPNAVARGNDGYLQVNYDRLGLRLERWEDWSSSRADQPF